jgi:hypothetical protein
MFRFLSLLLLLCCLPLLADAPKEKHAPKDKKKPNALIKSSSPYLLQHAYNPVQWYPWGEEAFAKAKKEGKLVFLSIGYSSCHWCHVMEKESFANDAVAKILNDHFVCIKVDREERPDIDHIYMTALNVMGNNGGWPLSMFLDAQGRPIIGGTYFPREDRIVEGREVKGFKTLLNTIQEFHKDKKDNLEEQAEKMASATSRALSGLSRALMLVEIDEKLLSEVLDEVKETFDRTHGGIGNPERKFAGAKFPRASVLRLVQHEAARVKSKELNDIVEISLEQMALGGIYDHLGGGFHRYSTERTWTVPHFEKMLYDNGQLLEVYALAYQRTKRPLYARVLRQTIDFVAREMTSPEGAFYSALDASTDGEEGKFYVWTAEEIEKVLVKNEDVQFFRKAYGAAEGYNFESKYHIFRLPKSPEKLAADFKISEAKLEERLVPLRKALFDARSKRERPFLDTKVLTAWNAQMIAGLVRASQALEDKDALARAIKATDFLLKTMKTKEGRLLRSYAAVPGEKPIARFNAYLEDYSYLVNALLTLHDATKEKKWLDEAQSLTETMIKYFGDGDKGGYYYTSSDHEKFFARAKDQYDGAQPAANSIAAQNFVRLWSKTGDEKYKKLAEKTIRSLSAAMKASPSSLCATGEALAMLLEAKKMKK